jgi:hypothetical protein
MDYILHNALIPRKEKGAFGLGNRALMPSGVI